MPTLEDLGVTNLMVFDIRAPFLIERYDRFAYMRLARGEFSEPPPLLRYPQIRMTEDGEVKLPLDHAEKPPERGGFSRAVVH